MSTRVGGVFVDFMAGTAGWKRDLDKAAGDVRSTRARVNRSLAGISKSFRRTRRDIARAAKGFLSFRSAIGAVAGTAGIGLLIKRSIDAADSIGKAADVIGISTRSLQEYRFAADIAGVSQEQLDKSLKQFAKVVGETRAGTGTLITLLNKMDPALLKNLASAKSTEGALKILFRAMGKLGSQTDRVALSNAAFGRSGKDMTNIVKNGAAEMEAMRAKALSLGIVIDDALIRGSEDAKDKLTILATVIKANVTRAVVQNATEIGNLAVKFTNLIPKVIEATGELKKFFQRLTSNTRLRDEIQTIAEIEARIKEATSSGLGISIRKSLARPLDIDVKTIKELRAELARLKKDAANNAFGDLGLGRAGGVTDTKKSGVSGGGTNKLTKAQLKALVKQAAARKAFLERARQDFLSATGQQIELIKLRTRTALAEAKKIGLSEADLAKVTVEINTTAATKIAEVRKGLAEAAKRANESQKTDIQDVGAIADTTFSGIADIVDVAFSRTETRAQDLRNTLLNVFDQIRRAAIQALVIDPLIKQFKAQSKKGGGGLGGILGGLGSALGSLFGTGGGNLAAFGTGGGITAAGGGAPFAQGGSFDIKGPAGLDKVPVNFRATPGERVTVETPAQRRAGSRRSGSTVFIDARGADREGLARLTDMVKRLNGSIEERAVAAVVDANRRDGRVLAG